MVDTIHRTLIIRFSSVGDIILSSLLLRTLHTRFPGSRIDYLVKTEYADLVEGNPHVTEVIAFPSHGGFQELKRLRRRIRETSYDLVVDIHDSLRSRYLCFGIPNVVRIHKRKLARFLLVKTKWNVYDCFGGSPGVAERYLETVHTYGVTNDGKGLEIFRPEAASAKAGKTLLEANIKSSTVIIGVCPSARHRNKMWLKERFAETVAVLARDYGAAILLFGSGGDEEIRCGEVKALIEQRTPEANVLNLAGTLSLTETAELLDRCSIILSNDSGLMHLAAACKRKVVAIFGPTVRELGFFPYGTTSTVIEVEDLSCRPCTHIGLPDCPKGHFKCMNDIHSTQVIAAARLLLESRPAA